MKSLGNLQIPGMGGFNPTSPTGWIKMVMGVVILFIILGVGYWLYKKLKEKVPVVGSVTQDVWG